MSPPADAPPDDRAGTTVAERYRLVQRLGQGGAGTVYRAEELGTGRAVAVKLFDQESVDPDALERIEREVFAARQIKDLSCIEIFASGHTPDGLGWIAMELVAGRDLSRALDEDGPFTPARAANIADQLLRVLVEAHGAGIVHRDLKPANVMVVPVEGAPERIEVLDFGISVLATDDTREKTGVVFGTPAYMSPEQLRGEAVDGRADLYAVGVMLFEMLAGVPPFDGPTPIAVVTRQLEAPAPPLEQHRPGVPRALAELVASALERERDRRPASAAAMRAALANALSDAGPELLGAVAPPRQSVRRDTLVSAVPPTFAGKRRGTGRL
ncbi:MAG: serine/threonine-protein kinase [Anaeromyxobacteraceae bacterium]